MAVKKTTVPEKKTAPRRRAPESKPARSAPAKSPPKPEARTAAPRPPATPERKPERKPEVPVTPLPSDLERPVPEEPVRIQPPPELATDRHGTERAAWSANRWVRQRPNQTRGGRWQTHGHSSVRGR